jgi:hypothetical protein
MQKNRRGRPRGACADFQTDRDAPAVVLLDAQMRFASLRRGKRPSERYAAKLAVLACNPPSHVTGPTQYQGIPPRELASTGHRTSPLKNSLRGGYCEIEVKMSGRILEADADRVRKKLAGWRKRPDARMWLSASSYELAQQLYRSLDPDQLRQRHLATE